MPQEYTASGTVGVRFSSDGFKVLFVPDSDHQVSENGKSYACFVHAKSPPTSALLELKEKSRSVKLSVDVGLDAVVEEVSKAVGEAEDGGRAAAIKDALERRSGWIGLTHALALAASKNSKVKVIVEEETGSWKLTGLELPPP